MQRFKSEDFQNNLSSLILLALNYKNTQNNLCGLILLALNYKNTQDNLCGLILLALDYKNTQNNLSSLILLAINYKNTRLKQSQQPHPASYLKQPAVSCNFLVCRTSTAIPLNISLSQSSNHPPSFRIKQTLGVLCRYFECI